MVKREMAVIFRAKLRGRRRRRYVEWFGEEKKPETRNALSSQHRGNGPSADLASREFSEASNARQLRDHRRADVNPPARPAQPTSRRIPGANGRCWSCGLAGHFILREHVTASATEVTVLL